MKTHLFSPLQIRDIEFKNRIFVSPMCQYSCADGLVNNWHLVHLGSRAVGGAGLIIVEATAVSPEGRISPEDAGIWNDHHVKAFKPITEFIQAQNAVAGIQLAHAGRKGSTGAPWNGGLKVEPQNGGWIPVAPSAEAFSETYPTPTALDDQGLEKIRGDFRSAIARALKAGFQVVELHMAHGYLMHEFLSPLSNRREDRYGGSLENRMRFPLEVAALAREAWPSNLPLFVRISSTDWVDGGWSVEDSVAFASELKKRGVDLVDCSTGGNVPNAKIPVGPSYQVAFAEQIRREAEVLTGAVGMITSPAQAEGILATNQADVVLIAREMLRDPYWPIHAARELKAEIQIPKQYLRSV